jgi:hypothetical protein
MSQLYLKEFFNRLNILCESACNKSFSHQTLGTNLVGTLVK